MKHILTCSLAILTIGGLEMYALSRGIDGIVLTLSIATIAGLGGYNASKILEIIKGGKRNSGNS